MEPLLLLDEDIRSTVQSAFLQANLSLQHVAYHSFWLFIFYWTISSVSIKPVQFPKVVETQFQKQLALQHDGRYDLISVTITIATVLAAFVGCFMSTSQSQVGQADWLTGLQMVPAVRGVVTAVWATALWCCKSTARRLRPYFLGLMKWDLCLLFPWMAATSQEWNVTQVQMCLCAVMCMWLVVHQYNINAKKTLLPALVNLVIIMWIVEKIYLQDARSMEVESSPGSKWVNPNAPARLIIRLAGFFLAFASCLMKEQLCRWRLLTPSRDKMSPCYTKDDPTLILFSLVQVNNYQGDISELKQEVERFCREELSVVQGMKWHVDQDYISMNGVVSKNLYKAITSRVEQKSAHFMNSDGWICFAINETKFNHVLVLEDGVWNHESMQYRMFLNCRNYMPVFFLLVLDSVFL